MNMFKSILIGVEIEAIMKQMLDLDIFENSCLRSITYTNMVGLLFQGNIHRSFSKQGVLKRIRGLSFFKTNFPYGLFVAD
jgi:hypothetical protein